VESEESRIQNAGLTNRKSDKQTAHMRQGFLGLRERSIPKSNTYSEEIHVDATGKQERIMNYPVRAVLSHDKYLTKRGERHR
jgi:hypothetical protein